MIAFSDMEVAGLLPRFFFLDDPRPAWDQLVDRYRYGAGQPFKGFALTRNEHGGYQLEYEGDPPLPELSRAFLRDELIVLFKYEWVAIIQPSGDFITYRVD